MPFHDLLRPLSGFASVARGALLLRRTRCCDLFVTFGGPASVATYLTYLLALTLLRPICDLWGTLLRLICGPCCDLHNRLVTA